MSNLATYRIGRDRECEVFLSDRSVSRLHAEIVVSKSGKFFLTDCKSNNGTYVGRGGKWVPIIQDFVEATEILLIGRHQTSVAKLVASARGAGQGGRAARQHTGKGSGGSGDTKDLPSGRVKRDPGTGDIIPVDGD